MGAAPIFYDQPLHIVRAEGCWMWDASGRRYLDAYNNVPHLGHCHPEVVQAIARQAATLNTHSRYLHDGILDYLDRLTARLGSGLTQTILTCTGSEAMDVALRMAQAATGATGLIATDNTYHGNTAAVSALSTRRPPVGGRPAHVRLVPAPDARTGLDGAAFGQAVAQAAQDLMQSGHGVAALVLCPALANEGLPCPPADYLAPAAQAVQNAGGLLIADEVQPGFGRLGTHWWGFRQQRITPDVVVLGKPMGNGYPIAAAIARPEVMTAFHRAFGYFNTFAATPVAAAAATAVLDVLEAGTLIPQAATTGATLLDGLRTLHHPRIAQARGHGLFFALEFETPSGAPCPATAQAVVEGLKAQGVLAGRIGRQQHILKLRPPMVFAAPEAELLLEALRAVLADLPE
jgi:4-aminobutyrate aminotransferase-like enzyme